MKLETRNLKLAAAALAATAMLTAWPLSGDAQVLNDPTRPPAIFFSGATGEAGAVAAPLLQSVMISPTERSAIIGGERVKQGGKYGDARVIRITESEVVLRSASGTETLRMYPDIEMKLVKPAPAARPKPARKPAVKSKKTRGKPQ
ncbi:MAG: MSHA biogenesis protein MshK [Betaproteobacteria bacterium]|nr:MSHA biogenesis protein MshK [Betaproteobacteria bacterium]